MWSLHTPRGLVKQGGDGDHGTGAGPLDRPRVFLWVQGLPGPPSLLSWKEVIWRPVAAGVCTFLPPLYPRQASALHCEALARLCVTIISTAAKQLCCQQPFITRTRGSAWKLRNSGCGNSDGKCVRTSQGCSRNWGGAGALGLVRGDDRIPPPHATEGGFLLKPQEQLFLGVGGRQEGHV